MWTTKIELLNEAHGLPGRIFTQIERKTMRKLDYIDFFDRLLQIRNPGKKNKNNPHKTSGLQHLRAAAPLQRTISNAQLWFTTRK